MVRSTFALALAPSPPPIGLARSIGLLRLLNVYSSYGRFVDHEIINIPCPLSAVLTRMGMLHHPGLGLNSSSSFLKFYSLTLDSRASLRYYSSTNTLAN